MRKLPRGTVVYLIRDVVLNVVSKSGVCSVTFPMGTRGVVERKYSFAPVVFADPETRAMHSDAYFLYFEGEHEDLCLLDFEGYLTTDPLDIARIALTI